MSDHLPRYLYLPTQTEVIGSTRRLSLRFFMSAASTFPQVGYWQWKLKQRILTTTSVVLVWSDLSRLLSQPPARCQLGRHCLYDCNRPSIGRIAEIFDELLLRLYLKRWAESGLLCCFARWSWFGSVHVRCILNYD